MTIKFNAYKLQTPFGISLHETDEADGRIHIPTSIFRRCWFWRLINARVTVYRLDQGKWKLIHNWSARKLKM